MDFKICSCFLEWLGVKEETPTTRLTTNLCFSYSYTKNLSICLSIQTRSRYSDLHTIRFFCSLKTCVQDMRGHTVDLQSIYVIWMSLNEMLATTCVQAHLDWRGCNLSWLIGRIAVFHPSYMQYGIGIHLILSTCFHQYNWICPQGSETYCTPSMILINMIPLWQLILGGAINTAQRQHRCLPD